MTTENKNLSKALINTALFNQLNPGLIQKKSKATVYKIPLTPKQLKARKRTKQQKISRRINRGK